MMLLNPVQPWPASRPQFALALISFFSELDMFSHLLKHSIPPHPLTALVSIPHGWSLGLVSEPAASPQPSMTLSTAAAAGVNCPSPKKGCRQGFEDSPGDWAGGGVNWLNSGAGSAGELGKIVLVG